MAFFVKTFYFGQMSKFDPPVFVFVFVCAHLYLCVRICICICVFVFVFDHDHLLFWFIFDENPFLRLRLASHDNLGVSRGGGPFLGDGTSETLSKGIPAQLFDSPWPDNCPKTAKMNKRVHSFVLVIFCLGTQTGPISMSLCPP